MAKIEDVVLINFMIEPEAKNAFAEICVKYGVKEAQYLRLRLTAAVDFNKANLYSNPANKWNTPKKKIVQIRCSKDDREAFQNLCDRIGSTPSDVLRGWIYECIDLNSLWRE